MGSTVILMIPHTDPPPSTLFQVAFEHVASTNLKMKVHCDFLQNYLEKYAPEFKQYEA